MTLRPSTVNLLASTLFAIACLPVDTRPEPARVVITVDLPSDLREAQLDPSLITFQTDDGWVVTLDHLFVSMGYMALYGDNCNSYAEAWYARILDLSQPGPQKLGQVWGLNDCRLGYEVDLPREDSVLGAGITEKDRDFIVTALVPVSSPTGLTTSEGMTTHVRGSAAKAELQLGFDWGFSDELEWAECKRLVDGKLETRLPLTGGETTTVVIAIDPRNLFRVMPMGDKASPSTGSPLPLMQLIADADQTQGNGNRRVALDELIKVQIPGGGPSKNLAEVMRQFSYPSMFVYGSAPGAQCELNPDDEGHSM